MDWLIIAIAALLLLIVVAIIFFELLYQKRDTKTIAPYGKRSEWEVISETSNEKTYKSTMFFKNYNEKYEGTMANMRVEAKILFKDKKYDDITVIPQIIPHDEGVRQDGYIPAFLMASGLELKVDLFAKFVGNLETIDKIHAVVIRVYYSVYDRRKYRPDLISDAILVPVKEVIQTNFNSLQEKGALIYPVKTHLLTDSDDFAKVIKRYAGNFLKQGDVVVIAESPIAIVESRFRHPSSINPSWWAKRLCYFVPSKGSLSSPYGMQCAIDQIGTFKFVSAMFAGFFMKLLGKNGWFYTLAGMESELIDDLTGTIPPYDQYVVLGPENPEKFVYDLKKEIGVDVAIADANDLKKARILACTIPSAEAKIRNWMLNNPAGNSSEQTPIVIIRPDNLDSKTRNEHDQTCEV
ncbi:MAG: hypothetical protein U0354_13230 [Candidatus Sericytochromatia bacterium]